MLSLPSEKIHNAYIIETYNYEAVKEYIKQFAIRHGFDSNLVYSDNHPDLIFIESDDNKLKIDTIRKNVIETANFSPIVGDRKFYVIYDSYYLENHTQNALLKTLEEPPIFDSFFLVTSNANKLLETIRSRCIIIKDNENINYKELLDLPYTNKALNILANLKYETESDILTFSYELEDENLKNLIRLYRCVIRDAFAYKVTLSKSMITIKEKEMEIIAISNSFTVEEFGKLINNLDRLSDEINYQINKRIALFNFYEV